MSILRRRSRPLLVSAAFIVLALALTACVTYKPGSFSLEQPAGIGNVRVHFVACGEIADQECAANESESEGQAMFAISVPQGAGAPPTVTAVPLQGGPAVVLTRNDQVAQAIADATRGTAKPWPPAGSEGVGYISPPLKQEKGLREWALDADLTLPKPADGGPFGGPFPVSLWVGTRNVAPEFPASRPVDCSLEGEPIAIDEADCDFATEGSLGTADLKVGAPPQSSVFLGGKATLAFPMEFAGTPGKLMDFRLAVTSTLPKAGVTLDTTSHVPKPGPAGPNRSPVEPRTVTVAVPKNAKPGIYDVTLTATTPEGGSVSQVAKLQVAKARIKLGKVKFNKAKGTAVLLVRVPAAGALTVSGKGLAKTKAKAGKAKRLRIQVKPKAKTKVLLARDGKARVRAKITFKPAGAFPVVKSRSIVLKKSL